MIFRKFIARNGFNVEFGCCFGCAPFEWLSKIIIPKNKKYAIVYYNRQIVKQPKRCIKTCWCLSGGQKTVSYEISLIQRQTQINWLHYCLVGGRIFLESSYSSISIWLHFRKIEYILMQKENCIEASFHTNNWLAVNVQVLHDRMHEILLRGDTNH